MADSDDLDLDGGDISGDEGGSKKKGVGLGSLLPTILKFAAIGLGALIFIVTVSVITFNIMNRGGRTQTIIRDPDSPYVAMRPVLSWFDNIGVVTTRTSDFPIPQAVSVEMAIGFDEGNVAVSSELNSRVIELQDFTRRYFARKRAADLTPDREEQIRREIREELNTRYLNTRGVRDIRFRRLEVMEMF